MLNINELRRKVSDLKQLDAKLTTDNITSLLSAEETATVLILYRCKRVSTNNIKVK